MPISEAEFLTAPEIFERARQFANNPSVGSWIGLVGEGAAVGGPEGDPLNIGQYLKQTKRSGAAAIAQETPDFISRSAASFQAALSTIGCGRQTTAQIAAWEKIARRLIPIPSRTIQGKRVREVILWAAPREDVILSNDSGGWGLVAIDAEALLATVLMWRLNPDQNFAGLHECGLGEMCSRERFHRKNRKYCCAACMRLFNGSTATERSRDRRERDKAEKLIKPRYPASAKELVWEVAAPGLTALQIVERVEQRIKREGAPTRPRAKHK